MRFTRRTLGFLIVGSVASGAVAGTLSAALLFSAMRFNVSSVSSQLQAPSYRLQADSDEAVTAVVDRVLPSVVSIDIREREVYRKGVASSTPTELSIGGGSGFFISEDGLVVTNRHVISDGEVDYVVVTQDGTEYPAHVLALDPSLDLGVLKVEGDGFPALELGDSDALRPGQTVIAIGNALAEFQNSVTKGIVSGLNRHLYAGDFGEEELLEEAIQTDAAVNPGNSGGPLLTLDGKVVGMNTAISDLAQSLGFALPSNALRRAVESVRLYGRIVRPWIGVRYVPQEDGALIVRGSNKNEPGVEPDSPAAKAGLREKDVIMAVDGVPVDLNHSLGSAVVRRAPGDVVMLKVMRDDKTLQIPLTLEERPQK